jgi:inorganic pyrophosphatase
MHYPGDYGFVPGTLAEDGDPMDVLASVDQPGFPGCPMEVRPVGIRDHIRKEIESGARSHYSRARERYLKEK